MPYYGNAPADVALVVGQDVITTTEIQDATIATADIASDAITATKIDDDGTGFQMGSLGLGTAVSGSHKLTVGGTATFSGDITGTLATASQGNITSVGTLTGLSVDNGTSSLNRGNSAGDILDVRGQNASQMKVTTTAFTVTPNATFAGTINATGNITTDGIFKVDTAPDSDVIQFDQSGRKSAIQTYFASSSTGSKVIVKVSNGNTDGTMIEALDVRPEMLDLPEGYQVRFGERGNITHDSSNYNMSFNTNSVSNAVVITGTGLLQAKRGFTNGQALDIEGETFGRTNSSNVAFGYRQDGDGQLMKIQKSTSDVFIMTNSGRIAQNISESSAYAVTFENTSSGGHGLRVYGGASSADYLIRGLTHGGTDKFAVKSNGRIERPTHRDNQGTFVINPDGSANDNWLLTLTSLNYGFATIRIGAYGHSSYVNIDINLGGHMASGGTYYNANVVTNESSSDIIVTLTQNQTGYIVKLSNNTNADQVYGHYQVIDGGYNGNATITVENSNT